MAFMPKEVRDLFDKVPTVSFATCSADGQPNISAVGMKKSVDDETLYLSDQFFKKTLANIQVNPKVSVAFWEGHDAYQIHGTARYINEGPEFEEQKAWSEGRFAAMGLPITTKGGCFVKVDAVFITSAGPRAGEKIA